MGKGQADKTPQQLKEEGNEAYKSGDLDTAIVKYTEVRYNNNLDIGIFTVFNTKRYKKKKLDVFNLSYLRSFVCLYVIE